jgi:hypothetical protein
MTATIEIYAHMWVRQQHWVCGIVDHRTAPADLLQPAGPWGYSALSLTDPNVLIHVYWLGGLPSDAERDNCQSFIVSQALGFYAALQGEA